MSETSLTTYNFEKLRLELINETIHKISTSIGPDFLIKQASDSISEIDKAVNILSKRLREWYELYDPEGAHNTTVDRFIKIVLEAKPQGLESMGGTLEEKDLLIIRDFAEKINTLYEEKGKLVDYIKDKMSTFCPNVLELAGPLIGAKLMSHKGTLRELAFMPSSTIQILGAEKALFRHLKSNARSPKYGYLLQHQDVANAPVKEKGKVARQLANKISLAAKKDYFKLHPVDF